MSVRPLVVAAALVGAFFVASLVAALAFASGGRVSADVTLQIAPRGLGTVTATPADKNGFSVCSDNTDGQSCPFTYNRGDHVKLAASSDARPGVGVLEHSRLSGHRGLHGDLGRRHHVDRRGVQSVAARRAVVVGWCRHGDGGSGRQGLPPGPATKRRCVLLRVRPRHDGQADREGRGKNVRPLESWLRAHEREDLHDHRERRDDLGRSALRRRRPRRNLPTSIRSSSGSSERDRAADE